MLKEGSYIEAKLIEQVEKNHWIVSFQGQLLQVKNSTTLSFQEGLKLKLRVESMRPFRLKVLGQMHQKKQGLNISI